MVAIVAGGVLAVFAASGPAVAFFSGGLFLDVHVESPATLVQTTSGGKTFKQGTAVASAEIFGCAQNFSVCGSETDSQTIDIQK